MRIGQRVLMIIAVIFVAVNFCFILQHDKKEKMLKQWEQISVEKFLQKAKRKQEITLNEYMYFLSEIRFLDKTVEANMEVYRKEWNLHEDIYYFLLPQDEIEKILERDDKVELQEGSIIQVFVQHKSKRNVYGTVVSGKGD